MHFIIIPATLHTACFSSSITSFNMGEASYPQALRFQLDVWEGMRATYKNGTTEFALNLNKHKNRNNIYIVLAVIHYIEKSL